LRLRPELDPLPAELRGLGVSYDRASAGTYAAFQDLGDVVWTKGPPRSGLLWQGPPGEALRRLAPLPDDAGTVEFWPALGQIGV
jgi:hypothetical protein